MSHENNAPRVLLYAEHGGQYTVAGSYEIKITAPPGYRIVSGGIGLAEDSNSNTEAAKFQVHGSYAVPSGGVQVTQWQFLFSVTEVVNFVTSVLCERSDAPDVQV